MIEMTWGQIRDPKFHDALNKIIHADVEFKTAKKILDLSKALEPEVKKSDEMAKMLSEKYGELTEDGKWKLKATFNREEFAKTDREFAETKCTFPTDKLKPSELEKATLSALDLVKLEPILEE